MGKAIQFTGDAQAAYWTGSVSRRELQHTLDEYTGELKTILDGFAEQIAQARSMALNLDLAVQCLAEKLGVAREEIQDWSTKKLAGAKVPAGSNDAPV